MQNFMKTIINASQFWTKKEIKNSTADWMQNDPNAVNYVKNRTHWEEESEKELLEPITVEIDFSYEPFVYVPTIPFVENQTYIVTWDGKKYSCIAYATSDDGIAIGNGDLFIFGDNSGDGNGEPFFYASYGEDFAGLFSTESGVHTISITTSETVVHKLDPKYLPELTATPDWNQNDPEGAGYIKNRPFYEVVEYETYIPEQTAVFSLENSECVARIPYVSMPWDWVPYRVTFDNVEYEGTMYDNASTAWIEIILENDIQMRVHFDGHIIIFSESIVGEHTIKVEMKLVDVHKIDDKYLSIPVYSGEGEQSICVNSANNVASDYCSHAEGYWTTASGNCSHAEGSSTTASGNCSHAEGGNTTASSFGSHAEGDSTTASGKYSHAEGNWTTASGNYSHAEGSRTTASGNYSHAEGCWTTASGDYSHAEGCYTTASSDHSHAEGYYTTASGSDAHAEGRFTTASGNYSHAEGLRTTASGYLQRVSGKFNIFEPAYIAATNVLTANKKICKYSARNSIYYSDGYTFDDTTGLYTLVPVEYDSVHYFGDGFNKNLSLIKDVYVIHGGSSGNTMYYKSDMIMYYTGTTDSSDIVVFKNATEYTSVNTATSGGKYVSIVGNGTDFSKRSNAHTLDWNGVGWYQGGLQVGGNAQDNGAKNVLLEGDAIPVPSSATTGQILAVKSVDETGKPTEWEAVDAPQGGGGKLEPLIGTTEEITPAQVLEALSQGRMVALEHNDDEYLGTVAFTGFHLVVDMLVASALGPSDEGILLVYLLGSLDGDEWVAGVSTIPDKADIPTDDHINDLINTALGVIENATY